MRQHWVFQKLPLSSARGTLRFVLVVGRCGVRWRCCACGHGGAQNPDQRRRKTRLPATLHCDTVVAPGPARVPKSGAIQMRLRRNRQERPTTLTPYQRVKRRAGLSMMAIGVVIAIGTLATLFIGSLEVTLFLAAVSLGFLLVGLQQEFDVLAVGADIKERRQQDGKQAT